MPTQTTELAGSWEKITQSACSENYPDSLSIDERGFYSAVNTHPSILLWDAGTFTVMEPGRVRISLANDALFVYDFTIDGDVLTFTDSAGCPFSYRRKG